MYIFSLFFSLHSIDRQFDAAFKLPNISMGESVLDFSLEESEQKNEAPLEAPVPLTRQQEVDASKRRKCDMLWELRQYVCS